MKSISLFVDNGTYLTKVHPFTKLMYIAAAISIPLITGKLWMFGVFIAVSLCVLASGKILKKTFPLIAFSFTILLTIFLIHGLFNQRNENVLFQIGGLKFYREGTLYALHIGLNILNMLLSFAVFVLSTKPSEFVDELEKRGFSPRFGYIVTSVFQIIPQMMGTMNTIMDAQRSRGLETEGNLRTADLPGSHEFPDQYQRAGNRSGGAWIRRRKKENMAVRSETSQGRPGDHDFTGTLHSGSYCMEDRCMSEIIIENLRYRYPHAKKLALDGLNFSVEKGEFIGVIGENGAGKSTLSQAIMGLVPQFYKGAYGGKVIVDGIEAGKTPVSQLCGHVGLVFQNPFNQLSGAKDNVYEEVAFGMQNLGIPAEEMKERVENALKLLDIWQYRDRNPFDLSGGQMQRVAIASVLVMRPDVMILDEPTSQLDPEGSDEVFRAVETLTNSGITILMIEQKIEKLAAYCDRILLLHGGKQIAFDTPQKVFSMPDLADYGIQEPAFTRICKAEHVTLPDGTYPVTVEEAAGVLKERHAERAEAKGAAKADKKKDSEVLGEEQFLIKNLDFSYLPDVPVLKALNMRLDKRPTAIIGQNGAGKTTLVKLLKGLLKPVSGKIYFRGEDISGKTVAMLAGNVGYVFQNPDDQIFKYNVMDEIMFGPMNIGMDPKRAEEEARRALELTGLTGKEKENPYDLELYERKMTAIASVLAMDTDVLILDEPTIAQDWKGRQIIGGIIRSLSERGKLVIAILHDMDFVAENFERVIIMAHGQVLADGTARDVFMQDEALKKARLQKPYMMQLGEVLGYERAYLTVDEILRNQVS